MFDATRGPERPSRVPGVAAWVVGIVLGVPLGLLVASLAVALDPHPWLRATDRVLPDGLRLHADRLTLDRTGPTWRWQVEGLAVLGAPPAGPVVLVDHATLTLPRLRPSATLGLAVEIADVSADEVVLWWPERRVPSAPAWSWSPLAALTVAAARAGSLEIVMREDGPRPELLIDGEGVTVQDLSLEPRGKQLRGRGAIRSATVSVVGVAFDDVRSDDVRFTGPGLAATAEARLGGDLLRVDLEVSPLMGPPVVALHATMTEGHLSSIAETITAADLTFLEAVVSVDATLLAGRALPGESPVWGEAAVDVRDLALTLPDDLALKARTGLGLAPFVTLQQGVAHFPDVAGRVHFTASSLRLDRLELDAPHSVGVLEGRVESTALDARLDMQPRPGHGAIRWGLLVSGDFGHPEVKLAFPPALDRWADGR